MSNIEQRILPAVTALPYDVATAKVFGQIRARLETAGIILPDADTQIAATASKIRRTAEPTRGGEISKEEHISEPQNQGKANRRTTLKTWSKDRRIMNRRISKDGFAALNLFKSKFEVRECGIAPGFHRHLNGVCSLSFLLNR